MSVTRTPDNWRKSTYSQPSENCVEVNLDVEVGVRDTKDRLGGQLALGGSAWRALLAAVR